MTERLTCPGSLTVTPANSHGGCIHFTAALDLPEGFTGVKVVFPFCFAPFAGADGESEFCGELPLSEDVDLGFGIVNRRSAKLFTKKAVCEEGKCLFKWKVGGTSFFNSLSGDVVTAYLPLLGLGACPNKKDGYRVLDLEDRPERSAFELIPSTAPKKGGPLHTADPPAKVVVYPKFRLLLSEGGATKKVDRLHLVGQSFWQTIRENTQAVA